MTDRKRENPSCTKLGDQQFFSQAAKDRDDTSCTYRHKKIVFKSSTGDIVPPGLFKLTCLANAGLEEICFFPVDSGELSYEFFFMKIVETIKKLDAIAHEGWSLLPKYRKVLTKVSGNAQKRCGESGTNGHEVALRLIDSFCVEASCAVAGICDLWIPGYRGPHLSEMTIERLDNMVSEFDFEDWDYTESVIDKLRKKTNFAKRTEVQWLQKQLEVEYYAAAKKLLEEKKRLVQTNLTASVKPKEKTPRLTVDTQANSVTLDGKKYDLTADQAYFVHELVKADGLWRSAREINITKPDRVKKKLPNSIQKLIESQPGKGSRIPREKLWKI